MAETVILDPAAVATGRTELDITGLVNEQGIDFGDAAIEQYVAEVQRGQLPVDFRVPNRHIEIPLLVFSRTGMTFEQARQKVQAKVALFQRHGGWVSRQTAAGKWYADIVGATLKLGGSRAQALWGIDADAMLTLETLPDWYGDEVQLGADHLSAGAAELVFKENGPVLGDYPARVRVVVDNDAARPQRGLIWAMRSQYYSAAPTAKLAYEAESLTPLDSAAVTGAVAGTSGGSAIQHNALTTEWSPVVGTDHAVDGAMTHVGTYRVWARARTTSSTPPRLRFVYDVGDLVRPTENRPKRLPASNALVLVDLGEIRVAPAPVGTHRWKGQIQGAGDSGGENVTIDKVWYVPVDDGYGTFSTPTLIVDGTSTTAARDAFEAAGAGGNLNARVPPVGAAWATSGAATDFQFINPGAGDPPTYAVSRSAATAAFRFGVFGPVMTAMQVRALVGTKLTNGGLSGASGFGQCGVLARWVDANNHVRLTIKPNVPPAGGTPPAGGYATHVVALEMVVAGAVTVLASTLAWNIPSQARLDLTVSGGLATGRVDNADGTQKFAEIVGFDNALATAGALDDGKGGIIDAGDGTNVVTRWYTRVTVTVAPQLDAVIYNGRSLQLRTDGPYRQTIDGVAYGPCSYPTGDLPRLPPSGLEARPVEIFLKTSRGDLVETPDDGIDAISAQVFYRPCWLTVPGA